MESPSWYVLRSNHMLLQVRNVLTALHQDFFLPTETITRTYGGCKKRVERPIALNLLFLHADRKYIDQFLRDHPELNLGYFYQVHSKHSRAEYTAPKPIVIDDEAMKLFVRTVGQYTDSHIPYLKPDEAMLQEGDHVRIIGGQFDGVEGVLLSSQGKAGGRVLVSVSNVLAVPTLHIEPEFLQILRFGKGKKHFYKQVDAYETRLKVLMNKGCLTDIEQQSLRIFVRRFSALKTETAASQLRLLSILYASCMLTGETEEAQRIRRQIEEAGLMGRVTERNSERARHYLSL